MAETSLTVSPTTVDRLEAIAAARSGAQSPSPNGTVFAATGNNYTVPALVAQCEANQGSNPNPTCESPNDYFDAAMAFDPSTGAIKWGHVLWGYDAWTVACITGGSNCHSPAGPD